MGLAEALAMLRKELTQAQNEGEGHPFQFEITEAEAELVIEIDAEGGTKAEGSIGDVTREAGGTVTGAYTRRLTVKLRLRNEITRGRNLEVRRDEARSWDLDDDTGQALSWDEGDKPRQ